MSKREIRNKISHYKDSVRDIKSAINDVESANSYDLGKAKRDVTKTIGGQAGNNIISNISKLISDSNYIKNKLEGAVSSINSEIYSLEIEYDNEEE